MREKLAHIEWERWRLPLTGAGVLLIVVAPFLLLRQLSHESLEAGERVAHTQRVETLVHLLTVELREAESAALAIGLGADAPFTRERLAQGLASVGPRIDDVIRATADEPEQQLLLGRLKEVLDRRMAVAAALADAPPARRTSLVRQLVFQYPVRSLLQEIVGTERQLLQQRTQRARQRRALAEGISWAAMLVQLLLLTAITAVLGRQMARRLEAETRVTRASARSSAALQTVREPIVLFDRDRHIVLHNAAFAQLYDLDGESPADSLEDVGGGVWRDPVVRQRLTDVLTRDRELWDYEHEQVTAGGVSRTLLINARRMPLPDRDDDVVLMTLSDVTAQKVAQQQIIELNRQLEGKIEQVSDVNRELEAFSYSVSHDLRAPLRHISGFADKLARHLGEGADERATHYLQVIGDSARRMSALIDDLLVYSRLGRSALRLQAVDMQSLVSETRAMLDANVAAEKNTLPSRIEWHIDPLPVLVADENMMRQVWQNLLGNAVKYSGKRDVAVVRVTYALEPDGSHRFSVQDNGAGFDMAYAGKLFGVFQRLHRASDYAGTGIGLASVRRVLTRHGGRIWAEAEVDRGATFHFTLPPALNAPPTPSMPHA